MSGVVEDNSHDTHDMTRLVKSTWGWADEVRVVPGLAVWRRPLQTHAQKLQITADIPQVGDCYLYNSFNRCTFMYLLDKNE